MANSGTPLQSQDDDGTSVPGSNEGTNSLDPLHPLARPEDWWRCLRRGPVSGNYVGVMTAPNSGGFELDLRIDIDPRYQNSPVLDKVSGDIYQVFIWRFGGRVFRWRIYNYSWIIDDPAIVWSRCSVTIAGVMRRSSGSGSVTNVDITVPWGSFTSAGPASVTFTSGTTTETFSCARQSDCFRQVALEVDTTQSVNAQPILPIFHTGSHNDRPADLPQRELGMEEAFREAGVCLTVNAVDTVIDDSAPAFDRWSVAELHDAMETSFSQIAGGWPKWQLWGLLCGQFDSSSTAGIMFDAAASFGGAGEPPERQGFAVFREHSWFDDLVDTPATTQAQAAAARQFLYTWVHEAGHAFNFLHSWNKSRPDALSWMNYPQRWDNRNIPESFWAHFRLQFDTEELMHLRHGARNEVIMGGDSWASGGHLEDSADTVGSTEGDAPVELLVRSKRLFAYMEPITIEVRVRNLIEDLPVEIDPRLDPAFGALAIIIMQPDGRIGTYDPVFCQIGDSERLLLKPASAPQGEERLSEEISIDFGKHGHYFTEPGEYKIRAVYQGLGAILVTSNVHRIRIAAPRTHDDELCAQDYFGGEAGLVACLGGSRSPYLERGWQILENMVDRYKNEPLGAKIALALGQGLARQFYRQDDERRLKLIGDARRKDALKLTSNAVSILAKDNASNIGYHKAVRWRAEVLAEDDRGDVAKSEVSKMRTELQKRNVNKSVLDEIDNFKKGL